jgi:hypothetical protein
MKPGASNSRSRAGCEKAGTAKRRPKKPGAGIGRWDEEVGVKAWERLDESGALPWITDELHKPETLREND